jgi:signal transduction histidine kinase
MLTLNLGLEAYYEQFNSSSAQELKDTEALSGAIYHKMLNEVNIFKVILYEIALEYPSEDSTLSDLIDLVEDVQAEIRKKRKLAQNKIRAIPSHDYQAIIDIISATAHDIADVVNNELFGIKSDIQFMQEDLAADDAISQLLTELLEQIEITAGALNDLKSIHQGVQISKSRFKVKSLFESWQALSKLGHATIVLHIRNGESQFEGDQHKIRGFLKELIENSLKHNPDQADLRIAIESRDVVNPLLWSRTIPGKRKYLRITFSDNGKGIAKEQKEWIFLPLKSTSPQGSGLGLFIIMKTLEKMGGYIRETGTQGEKFNIYLPYRREEQ